MNKLKLNKKIYEIETLIKAVNDYQHLVDIRIQDEMNYYLLTFIHCEYEAAETIKEFENYLMD